MHELKCFFSIMLMVGLSSFAIAKAPYIVCNASSGVILHSTKYGIISSPVKGTEIFQSDILELADDRTSVKIIETKTGESFSCEGKGKYSPRDIINNQKYRFWGKVLSYLKLQGEALGINTSPVYTSQCSIKKGNEGNTNDAVLDRSRRVALLIKNAIDKGNYGMEGVTLKRVSSIDNESYYYQIENKSSLNYGIAVYAISKTGNLNKHNMVLLKDEGRIVPDEIEYIPLCKNSTLDLDYFSISTNMEFDQTCYVLLFNRDTFYIEGDGEYTCLVDWEMITNELKYQGNESYLLFLE